MYFGQKILWNGVELVEIDKVWNWLHPSFRLALTPLSAISDEHAIEVGKLNISGDGFNYLAIGKSITHWLEKYGKNRDVSFEIYQQLIQWGYAVPLFIESGHPDNGKTAIELGIAIAKTPELLDTPPQTVNN